jgi:hypothetical protein
LAAPIPCANWRQSSYIAMEGRTTRGKVTMSLWTRILKSISLRAMNQSFFVVGAFLL